MRLRATFLCSLGLLSILGCDKRIPKEELGTVVFEVPAVSGAEKPPPMPELEGVEDPPDQPIGKHR
ncbi:MAG: hypothetical protein ABSG53_02655 [Thermoguttaceae bacterium]|jgi:hypothetical protein